MKQVPDAVADDVLALRLLLASTDAVSVRPGWQVFIPEGPDGPTVLEERELLPVAGPGAGTPAIDLTCVRRDGIDVTLSFGVRDGIQSSDGAPVAWTGTLRITLAGTTPPPVELGVSDQALTGPFIAERWIRAAVLSILKTMCKKHTHQVLRDAHWADAGFFVWPLRKALGVDHGLRVHTVRDAQVQALAGNSTMFPSKAEEGPVHPKPLPMRDESAPLDLEAVYEDWKADERVLASLRFWDPERHAPHGAEAQLEHQGQDTRELPCCAELQVRASGHLVLWSQGTTGEIFQLLPHNHGAPEPRVEAGRRLYFPHYPVHFPEWTMADGLNFSSPGTEKLLALVSPERLSDPLDLIKGDGDFCSVPRDHVEKLLRRARSIPGVELGFAKITLK